MSAMPVMIGVLCVMAIAYRYYSAFLAARVATLDDSRITPAVTHDDGSNYHPTNKIVLFGHHFAAISGAGPLIGPVLAAQFGYLPGLLWIVIGVCLAGAVQDFLVLGMSLRRDGKSLAQIAFNDVGKIAGVAAMIAILFILVIAGLLYYWWYKPAPRPRNTNRRAAVMQTQQRAAMSVEIKNGCEDSARPLF